MLRAAVLSAILVSAATPVAAVEIEDLGYARSGRPAGAFDLTASFSSLCCGIDRAAYDALVEHVRTSSTPTRAVVWAWGREGERSLGLTFPSSKAKEAFACELLELRSRLRRERASAGSTLPDPAFQLSGAQMKSCK